MRTIIEPFRIKMTEPISLPTAAERRKYLKAAHYNVFLLPAKAITIDLLTDSGTGAMSTEQWAALMRGDETYAGSHSWFRFQETVQGITGLKHIFPTHQGRAAEHILATTLIKKGMVVPNNSHFDTTRANMEYAGAEAVNLPIRESLDPAFEHPFKGNMDVDALAALLKKTPREKIPFCMMTVTNNTGGGQPVSMANLRAVSKLCKKHGIPLVLDCARFAENAYFIRMREKGYGNTSLEDIAREMFSYVSAATMSAKKDGLANIGGFLACNDDAWAEGFRNLLILTEGFPTYGGLAGRDLEVIAVGLKEALELDYQTYRHATVEYMARFLNDAGVPLMKPAGGHAVFIDAKRFCAHLTPLQYPGIGVVNALYEQGGVRAVELGTVMFGKKDAKGKELPSPLELVRLALPRRVYTQSHVDYVIEVICEVYKMRKKIPAHKITYQPPFLRHFSAHFEKAS